MKILKPMFMPKTLEWECECLELRGYWIIMAYAHVPGDTSLEVSAEYHIPFTYTRRPGGAVPYVAQAISGMTVSLSYKYQMLVREHAAKNKHAAAALEEIRNGG